MDSCSFVAISSLKICLPALYRAVVKVKFLHRGDGNAVPGRRAKLPGAHCVRDCAVDAIPECCENLQVSHLAGRIDGDIEHHLALSAVRQAGKVRFRAGRIGGERDLDVIGSQSVVGGSSWSLPGDEVEISAAGACGGASTWTAMPAWIPSRLQAPVCARAAAPRRRSAGQISQIDLRALRQFLGGKPGPGRRGWCAKARQEGRRAGCSRPSNPPTCPGFSAGRSNIASDHYYYPFSARRVGVASRG